MFSVKVDKERCKSCKLCIEICPNNLFKVSEDFNKMGYHYIETDKNKSCSGCKRCVLICPDAAIEICKEET
ncbi:MAG TPA: 4Fe-4S binding protein [bacterium]|nr:4Fe-4S binding protein [bacterium]